MKKLLSLIIFILTLSGCLQQDNFQQNNSSQIEAPGESETVVAGNEEEGSGGTEVVGSEDKLNTYPPQFHNFNSDYTFAKTYQVKLNVLQQKAININEVIMTFLNEDMLAFSPFISSSSHAELFDQNTYSQVTFENNSTFEFQLPAVALIDSIEFKFSDKGKNLVAFTITALDEEKKLYFADQLHDKRASYVPNAGSFKVNTTYKTCPQGKKLNYDGSCHIPYVLCSDYNTEKERGKTLCGFQRDGIEIFCQVSETNCQGYTSKICSEVKNYLTISNRLYTLLENGQQVHSTLCRNEAVEISNETYK